MTSGANGEWVRQGTPHDKEADWNEEPSEYGTAVSPTEWDDYSNEQSVPVLPPRAQVDDGAETAGSPGSPVAHDHEPVPGQEPDADEEFRSDEVDPSTHGSPAGDADDDGLEPARIEDPERGAPTSLHHDPIDDVGDADAPREGMTRPRPIVAEEPMADVDTAGPTDAAEYLAVDPQTVDDVDTDWRDGGREDEHMADDVRDEHVDVDDVDADAVDGDDEPTQHVDIDDMESTQAVPVIVAPVAPVSTGSAPDGLYRTSGAEDTMVIAQDTQDHDADVEEERLQAQLEAERQAREQRLGAVPRSSDNAIRDDAGPARVTTDRFFPSLGLFVLRLVVAGVLGLTSFQILGSGVDSTADFLAGVPLIPEPRLVAWILGFTLGVMALLLVIGLLQRVVGFVLLAVAVCSLVFIRWGNFAIFTKNVEGFIGDKDLLLAAIGLLLLTLGGGAWGIDGAFRRARAASKAERQN
ncbi:hypothetical protein [Tessaracoccus sp.]